ncbi:ArnT family glycosyltransferase [Candidatus Poribacteria bacterium]
MAIFDILFLLILLLALTALGRRLLKFAKVEFCSFIEEIVFSFGLGAGLIALLTLGIGFIGGFKRGIFYLLTFGLLGILILDVKAIIFGAGKWFKDFVKRFKWLSFDGALLAILLLTFLFTFICALAPQTSFDSLVHHLTVPKIYIQNGEIFNMSPDHGWYVMESNYPSNMEMLFTVGMLLGSDILTILISWALSIFLALSVYSLSRQFLSLRASLIAMMILYCAPMVATHAFSNDVDIGVAFFGLLALFAVFKWIYSGDHRFLLLSGVYAGFCAGTKYTGLPVVLVLALFIVLLSILERKSVIVGAKYMVLFGAIAFALAAPWYIKNYLYTGNPVYPFFAGIFTRENSPSAYSGHTVSTPWKGVDDYTHWYSLLLSYIQFPWDLTMMKSTFNQKVSSIGPLYLLFIPCLLFVRKIERRIKYLLLYGLTGLLIVFAVAQRVRYMFPFIPPLAIVAAYSLLRISEYDQILKKVFYSIMVVAMLFNISMMWDYTSPKLPIVLEIQYRKSYLSRYLGSYTAALYAKEHLPDSARILSTDPRGYYFTVPLVDHRNTIDYASIDNIEDEEMRPMELLKQMKALNISHVLTHDRVVFAVFSPERNSYYIKLAEQGKLGRIFKAGFVTLYEVRYDG